MNKRAAFCLQSVLLKSTVSVIVSRKLIRRHFSLTGPARGGRLIDRDDVFTSPDVIPERRGFHEESSITEQSPLYRG